MIFLKYVCMYVYVCTTFLKRLDTMTHQFSKFTPVFDIIVWHIQYLYVYRYQNL